MEITQYILLFFVELVILAVFLNFVMNHAEQGETVANTWDSNLNTVQTFVGNDFTNNKVSYANSNYMIYNHTKMYGFELESLRAELQNDELVSIEFPNNLTRSTVYLLVVTYDSNRAMYIFKAEVTA